MKVGNLFLDLTPEEAVKKAVQQLDMLFEMAAEADLDMYGDRVAWLILRTYALDVDTSDIDDSYLTLVDHEQASEFKFSQVRKL